MTSEEFKGFCESFYGCYGEDVDLEEGDKFEIRLKTGEVMEFEVSGEKIEAVHMLPGWTHNIINLSETENLVTIMWANEPFDHAHPDTYFEEV